MVTITLQRNDNKAVSDKVFYTQDTITINEQEFAFPLGDDVAFNSPHEQIIDPHRNENGVLHAMVIKQYTGKERSIFETCDEHGCYSACSSDNSPVLKSAKQKTTPVVAEIKVEEVKATTVADLIRNKETEVKDLKDQYLDADLDDDEELKISLKSQIQELKAEITLLNENINKG